MKNTNRENRKQLAAAGIWSLAVLAVVAVGMMTLFSAASRRTETEDGTTAVTESAVSAVTEAAVGMDSEEAAGFFTHDDPVDTEVVPDTPVTETEPAMESVPEADEPAAVYLSGENFTCIMPVNGTVTKEFTDDVAVYSLTMNDWRVHTGIDIYAPVGTNVMACAGGTVERVWEDPFLGQCIEINHGGGIYSRYANLSAELPFGMQAGTTVLAGDIIGGVGETMIVEMADTDHLHFSLIMDGVSTDPLDYMTNYSGSMDTDYEF